MQVEADSEPTCSATPAVSLIVPTYNTACYLPELIDSVINQRLTSWQLIIIDDGSTDNTEEVIEPYVAEHSNIEYHYIPNGGPGRARNIGMSYATGRWLMFVDSDDIIPANALRDLVELGERESCDIVTGDIKRLVNGKYLDNRIHRLAFDDVAEGRTTVYESPSLIYDTTACNKIFSHSFYERAGITWTEGRFFEDESTIMTCYCEAQGIGVLKSVVYLWRVRDKGPLSTTQQLATIWNFNDRMAAIHDVDRYFANHVTDEKLILEKDFKWLSHDLRVYLNRLPGADDEYRTVVVDTIAEYSEHIDKRAFARLRAIDRIKYTLARRRDGEGIDRALEYDKNHFPNLLVKERGGHLFGVFPFENLSDADTDMSHELRDGSISTKIKRAELWAGTLRITALMHIAYLSSQEAQVTVRLVDENGTSVAQTTTVCTVLPSSSKDARAFKRCGCTFSLKLAFDNLDELVEHLNTANYSLALDVSVGEFQYKRVTLANPVKGHNPRPFPALMRSKTVIVDYDVNKHFVLRVEQADRIVTSMQLEDNERFVFERTDGSYVQFDIPAFGDEDQRTFEFEDTQLLDSQPSYFVRRTALNADGLREGFMLREPDSGDKGYEFWRVHSNTKGHVRAQIVRPGAIVTNVQVTKALSTIRFAFPFPYEVREATLLLCKTGQPDARIPLQDEGLGDGGHVFSVQLRCASGVLGSLPLGTYRAKVEFALAEGTLVGWAWSGEPRDRAIKNVRTAARSLAFDRRGSTLNLSIRNAPKA